MMAALPRKGKTGLGEYQQEWSHLGMALRTPLSFHILRRLLYRAIGEPPEPFVNVVLVGPEAPPLHPHGHPQPDEVIERVFRDDDL